MKQHKPPNRPAHDVSQSYNSGMVTICAVTDAAEPGYQPQETRQQLLHVPYDERKLGIRRYYEAMQNQIHVERVIRIPKTNVEITNQLIAETEDGRSYRIDLVQKAFVYPPSLDLTLVTYEQAEQDENTTEVVEDG